MTDMNLASLDKYGGHELAAGVTVSLDNFDAFRQKINEYALSRKTAVPSLNIDFRLNPAGMSVDMAFATKTLEPFGMGNPTPIFGIFGVTLERHCRFCDKEVLNAYLLLLY